MQSNSEDDIPIFVPSKMAHIRSDNTEEGNFHVVFCKLYMYDCFQNKKCFFKGLTKVWVSQSINGNQGPLFYDSPNNSPNTNGTPDFNGQFSKESYIQPSNSIYDSQLRDRFENSQNFNVNEAYSVVPPQKFNIEDYSQSNSNYCVPTSTSQAILPNEFSDVNIHDEVITICSEDSQEWDLTQPIINEENTTFENCTPVYNDHNLDIDNYFGAADDTNLITLESIEDNTISKNTTSKLDYEMLLPHSVVESNSYYSLQSEPVTQDSEIQNGYDNVYRGLFENCEEVDNNITIVHEEIDRKSYFDENLYHQSSNLVMENDSYLLTDISNFTTNVKKGKNNFFVKNANSKCNICNRKCRSINALNHHMLVHSEDRPFVCEICKKAFKEQPTLRRHMWTHMDKQHQCDICQKYFVEKSSLRRHIGTIHADFKPGFKCIQNNAKQQFSCTKCGKVFKSFAKYTMHQDMHGNPNYECEICGKVYAGRSHLRIHKRIHTGEKPYGCNICNMQFAFKHVLKSHQARIHQKIHKFPCNLCSLSFEKKSDLSAHASCHILNFKKEKRYYGTRKVNKKFNIQECRKGICQKNIANFHIDSSVPSIDGLFGQLIDALPEKSNKYVEEEDFEMSESNSCLEEKSESCKSPTLQPCDQRKKNKECMECNKSFERMGDLKRHIISHIVENITIKAREQNHTVPTYECAICSNAIFKQVDKFKKHLREHAKLTLYQCNQCGRAFGDSSNYSKHKKVHGSSYLKCSICTRKFNTKRMMIRHMEYHRSNKPKNCPYCKKLFYFESNLRKHIKIAHLAKGKMTYKCEKCGVKFESVKLKWEHQWEVHGMRKVQADCDYCNAKFRKTSLLRAHVTGVHAPALANKVF